MTRPRHHRLSGLATDEHRNVETLGNLQGRHRFEGCAGIVLRVAADARVVAIVGLRNRSPAPVC
jgi:hypothetical protein